MALNQTIKQMRELLAHVSSDLEKAVGGNKAAAQRVRTGTVALEKIAKQYRKESVTAEKRAAGKPKKKAAAKKKAAPKKKAAVKKKVVAKKKAAPKKKATTRRAPAKKAATKRKTAKLPRKR